MLPVFLDLFLAPFVGLLPHQVVVSEVLFSTEKKYKTSVTLFGMSLFELKLSETYFLILRNKVYKNFLTWLVLQ